MTKAYDNHPSDAVHAPYNAEHLQESAQDWFDLMGMNESYPVAMAGASDLVRGYYLGDFEVSARKYARARFAMGLRAEDYNVA